jgi:ABC-type multidrug transport system ATPase subunit
MVGKEPDEQTLLHEISAEFPPGHFAAILGPSGCGKSTLLKVVAGLTEQTLGSVHWEGRNLAEEEDLEAHEIGYVPQFSIAYDFLSVWENVEAAMRLRVGGVGGNERRERAEHILKEVGLDEIADRQVRVLSGGQKRRLALALEIVSAPALLLADEVTSGLDPKAEDEIVRLMKKISQDDKRIVLSVTHSLRHLSLYDSVLVLYQGHLAYHGPSKFLFHYFDVDNPEDLFPCLAKRAAVDWHRSWTKHHAAYTIKDRTAGDITTVEAPTKPREKDIFEKDVATPVPEPAGESEDEEDEKIPFRSPGAITQFLVLLGRRWRIFLRDRSQLVLQFALMFGFPFLVVIFAWDGLPQIKNLSMEVKANVVQEMAEKTMFLLQSSHVGSLVSGLVMFQVVLLTLMGSNNSAREIAGERLIFEKEKFAGLSPLSYVASKACFLSVLVAAQSVWMAVFVNVICHFPGDLIAQIALLMLVNGAMTAVCLGISALMKSPEQASLVSVYLVGFQLPLSGAVLALPKTIDWITQPFIAAYWSWSGFIQTMQDTRFYDMVLAVTQTPLSKIALCIWVLCTHIILGGFLAYTGCRHSRWE